MTKGLWNVFEFVCLNVSVFTQLSPGEIQPVSATLPAASFPSLTDKNTTYSILNPLPNNDRPVCPCSSYLRKCFLLVRFMRPRHSCGGPATSEFVIGIPRLIRLIMSLNSRIIIALLFRLPLYSPWFPLPDISKTAHRLGSHSGAVRGFFSLIFLFFQPNPGSQCGAGGLS